MYSKRKGTSGICGQLYESKLISLLYFRAIHDKRIVHFQLASNIDNIGAFDDICFKAKVDGFEKPILVFIQAKHRENEKQTLKNDLATYFDSYLKIRHIFESNNKDLLLNGAFDETECLFVIYTTARDEFSNDSKVKSGFCSILNDLINTGGTVKQPYTFEENIQFLPKIAVEDQITSLANRIAKLIMGEGNSQLMLTDELILRYHVILAQKVFNVSEIKPDKQRIATFRDEFFDTNEEYLVLFKDTLFKAILKKRKILVPDIEKVLSEFLAKPTDATILSKLIGTVISYDNGYLEFVKKSTKNLKQQLNQVFVSRSTVNQAVALAASEMLSSREFKVPAPFGNKDLTLGGSDAKKEGRLTHLTSKIIELIDKCNSSNIVTIDDSLEKGLLQLNGGLASTIGNIFVLDDDTKLMKITDNWDSLEDLAKRLYKKIYDERHNLHEYTFCFKIDKFPKLLFDCSEYEENIARDFLNKLLFYSNQADENHVEKILKSEIERYQFGHPNYFKAKTDAVFSKYHDVIQKWWKLPKQAPYLTRKADLFQDAINNIIKDPLMSSLNVTYMSKMKQCNYTFSEDAVRSLNFQEEHSNTFIITKNSVLTVLKVIQYFKDKEHVVLDLEYILNLPENDRNALHTEIRKTDGKKVLIFIFDQQIHNTRIENNILEIAKAVQHKPAIVITNDMLVEILKKCFSRVDNIIRDERSDLIDMSEESQKSILENTKVIFQGIEVPLNLIVDDESMARVTGVVLHKIINEEKVVVGKLTVNRNYDEIKHLYVDRLLMKTGDGVTVGVVVKTLNDIEDDVVLITAEPGMGKSTLLSHLSLKTKEYYPEIWIVRLNLLEYSRQFSMWKSAATAIDTLETLKFICQVIIREKVGNGNNIEIVLEEENDVVYLKHCMDDQWIAFELELFLHLYNKRKMMFLFDGFDEICPHYKNEVIKCLKSISNHPRKQRVWITSRSYNEMKTILHREFGSSYEICYLIYTETEKYLNTFLEFNLRLKELNRAQLENVENFLKYVSTGATVKGLANVLPLRPLHRVYNSATQYLLSEITNTHIPLWTHSLTKNNLRTIKDLNFLALCYEKENTYCGNPLYLFLAAYFFVSNIKNVNRDLMGWKEIRFLELNAFAFYEWFLETKIKRRYEEKNKMDIYNPDIMIAYEKDLADSILRYKKLAAYAIFNLYNLHLFSMRDLAEIKDMIKLIENGGEKTGLIYGVANEIPIFIHMTFTEHFAVEYVCDCLKNEIDRKKQISWIDFIIHVMFSESFSLSVRKTFDYKMDYDEILISVFEQHSEVTFESIMMNILDSDLLRRLRYKKPFVLVNENICLLSDVECGSVNNLTNLILKTVFKHLANKSKLNQFLEIVTETKLLPIAIANNSIKFPLILFELINKIDKSKLKPLLLQNFSYLSHSINYDEMSDVDLLKLIQEGMLEELSEADGTSTISTEQKTFFHLFSHMTFLGFW